MCNYILFQLSDWDNKCKENSRTKECKTDRQSITSYLSFVVYGVFCVLLYFCFDFMTYFQWLYHVFLILYIVNAEKLKHTRTSLCYSRWEDFIAQLSSYLGLIKVEVAMIQSP
jgi:hypothetical protein